MSRYPEPLEPKVAFQLGQLLSEDLAPLRRAIAELNADGLGNRAVNLLELLERSGFRSAEEAFTMVVESEDPSLRPAASLHLAELLSARDPRRALELAIDAANSGDDEVAPAALVVLAELYLDQDLPEQASALFRAAVATDHERVAPEAALRLAAVLGPDAAEALELYRQAASYDGQSAVEAALQAGLLLIHDDPEASARYLQRALDEGACDTAEKLASIAYILGQLYEKIEEPARAITAYRVAVSADAGEPTARAAFAQATLTRDDPAAAEHLYRLAIESGHPDVAPRALFMSAYVLEDLGRIDDALAALEQALVSGQPDAEISAAAQLGEVALARGDLSRAEQLWIRAADGEPAEARRWLFKVALEYEESGEAESAARVRAVAAGLADQAD